jgi:hypothetical protein
MASRIVDSNLLTPQAADGTAESVPAALATVIASLNSLNGADANWAIQALAAPGAITPTKRVVTLAVDGTDAFTLADGTYLGDEVMVVCISGANTPIGTVTPATRAAGYSAVTAFGALGDFCQFIWTSTGWMVGANGGVTVSA